VTDAWHYWAPDVVQFNAQIRARDAPPQGFEMLWAVGIDACVVCSVLQYASPLCLFSALKQVPIAKPSDILYERELANGAIEVDIIEAERRFFCLCDQRLLCCLLCNIMRMYKWVHGIKFQAICLPNGMIGNLSGIVLNSSSLQLSHIIRHCFGHSS
jgi:hypothetical protein